MKYEPLFSYFKEEEGAENAWQVVDADFVSTEDGTGIVHMAPAFGAEDFEVGKNMGSRYLIRLLQKGLFQDEIELGSRGVV